MTAKREDINQLCDIIRETSFAIHKYHRTGHLEKYMKTPSYIVLKNKALMLTATPAQSLRRRRYGFGRILCRYSSC